jgi:signal transduction histidine kinase
MLEQVLLNLVINARDAMPKGGSIRIEASPDQGADHVCLSIADNGCGMDAATRQRIFEPFFTTKPNGRGTGLGLTVVQEIVQAHQGRIEVESAPNQGSTFRVFLPSRPAPLPFAPGSLSA